MGEELPLLDEHISNLDFDTFLEKQQIELKDNELIAEVIKEELAKFNEGK